MKKFQIVPVHPYVRGLIRILEFETVPPTMLLLINAVKIAKATADRHIGRFKIVKDYNNNHPVSNRPSQLLNIPDIIDKGTVN